MFHYTRVNDRVLLVGIIEVSVIGKIFAGILLVCRVTEGLTDDEQGDFRVWRGCVDQI